MDFYEQNILNQAFNLHSAEMTEWTFRQKTPENMWSYSQYEHLCSLVLAVLAGPAGSGHWAGFQAILPPIFRVAVKRCYCSPSWGRWDSCLPAEGWQSGQGHHHMSPPELPLTIMTDCLPKATAKFHLQSLRGNNFNTTNAKRLEKPKCLKHTTKWFCFTAFSKFWIRNEMWISQCCFYTKMW